MFPAIPICPQHACLYTRHSSQHAYTACLYTTCLQHAHDMPTTCLYNNIRHAYIDTALAFRICLFRIPVWRHAKTTCLYDMPIWHDGVGIPYAYIYGIPAWRHACPRHAYDMPIYTTCLYIGHAYDMPTTCLRHAYNDFVIEDGSPTL